MDVASFCFKVYYWLYFLISSLFLSYWKKCCGSLSKPYPIFSSLNITECCQWRAREFHVPRSQEYSREFTSFLGIVHHWVLPFCLYMRSAVEIVVVLFTAEMLLLLKSRSIQKVIAPSVQIYLFGSKKVWKGARSELDLANIEKSQLPDFDS